MSFLTQSLDKVYLESVREKEGGSYGVSVYGQLSRYPNDDEAFLQIYFDTDPAKREKMTQIIMNELQKDSTGWSGCRTHKQNKRVYAEETYRANERKRLLVEYTEPILLV